MRGQHRRREIGAAAAIKMVRSVMIKGIEALTLECFLAAARAGVVDEVAASMKNNYPGLDWGKIVPYNLERMASHGERRAAEMEEVADTLRELGVEPLMTVATVSASAKWARSAPEAVRGALKADRAAMLGAISAAARDRQLTRCGSPLAVYLAPPALTPLARRDPGGFRHRAARRFGRTPRRHGAGRFQPHAPIFPGAVGNIG